MHEYVSTEKIVGRNEANTGLAIEPFDHDFNPIRTGAFEIIQSPSGPPLAFVTARTPHLVSISEAA